MCLKLLWTRNDKKAAHVGDEYGFQPFHSYVAPKINIVHPIEKTMRER